MSRVRRGSKGSRRRKKIMKLARGYRASRSRLFRTALEAVHRGWSYAYRDRRNRKRVFRRLWIIRINAAARALGTSYSTLMHDLKRADVALDRKVLADIALHDPQGFTRIVEEAGKHAA